MTGYRGVMLELGMVLGGRFRIDGVIGAGGMGIVFAATQLELGRAVCLKLMLPQVAVRPAARARFVREARLASRLRGEHVCGVHDVFWIDDATPCIVMERIDGRDLAAEVAARGPLPIAEAIEIVDQACAAIGEAHALGIIHRDLKPNNLLLARRLDGAPLVKVVDFGIAVAVGDGDVTTGAPGSPAFMAPEQARRGAADARADIYGLGAVLYFAVTGRAPFVGDSALEVVLRLQTEHPPPAGALRPDLPASVDRVIRRAMARRPERRFADVGALRAALAADDPPPQRSRRSFALAALAAALAALPAGVAPTPDRPARGSTWPVARADGTIGRPPPVVRAPVERARVTEGPLTTGGAATGRDPSGQNGSASVAPGRAYARASTTTAPPHRRPSSDAPDVIGRPRPAPLARSAIRSRAPLPPASRATTATDATASDARVAGVSPDGAETSARPDAARPVADPPASGAAPRPARCATDDFLCQFGAHR